VDQTIINTFWSSACSSVRTFAQGMARMACPEFGELLLQVAERFCSQPCPSTQEELDFLQLQRISVSTFLSTINTNVSMARLHPAATQELYDLAKEFSERPLPTTKEECNQIPLEGIAYGSKASRACNKYMR
jgi:hypothetical protein